MKRILVELEKVTKEYPMGQETVKALRGISLTIRENDFLSIMGPSGSGKSTLMHLIGCLDTPTQGRISLAGRDVSSLREKELAFIRNRQIGFIFQQFNLLSNLTILENVMAPLLYAGVPLKERERRARQMLERLGLGDHLRHRPNELSGGQRQRVAIARALINEPDLILADEPTGNLDTETGQAILNLLHELHREKRTIIIVTHDERIARLTHDLIKIQDGKIV